MEQFLAINDHMSCAYRHWQLRSPINLFNFYLLRSPRFNTCVPGIHRLLFVFPLVTFSRDADHKFWQLKLVLSVSHNSTQLTLITTDCAVIKVFKIISFLWRFHAISSSVIYFSTDHSVFPPFLSSPQDPYTVNAWRKKVPYGHMHPRSLISLRR